MVQSVMCCSVSFVISKLPASRHSKGFISISLTEMVVM